MKRSIEEINKQVLLNKVGATYGLEHYITINLYIMARACSYADMLEAYKLYKGAVQNDFFGFEV